jgi:hypothetical protein
MRYKSHPHRSTEAKISEIWVIAEILFTYNKNREFFLLGDICRADNVDEKTYRA